MGRRQGVGDGSGDGDDLTGRQSAALGQDVVEGSTGRELHGQCDAVSVVQHLEHPHDVRVVELGEEGGLSPEPFELAGATTDPQPLERYDPGDRALAVSPPHRPRCADSDLPFELVVADRRVATGYHPPSGCWC